MKTRLEDVIIQINKIAPPELAMEYDNIGLIVGDNSAIITGMVFCVDCTLQVVERAIANGSNLIISHHPLIFGGINNIVLSDTKAQIIKKLLINNINLVSSHTNLDAAELGTAQALANSLKLIDIFTPEQDKFIRIGKLKRAITGEALEKLVSESLNVNARLYGNPKQKIKTAAVAPGAASEAYILAYENKAEAFITGETKHHHIIDACAKGMLYIDAGHYASEYPGMKALRELLANQFKNIKTEMYAINPFTDI